MGGQPWPELELHGPAMGSSQEGRRACSLAATAACLLSVRCVLNVLSVVCEKDEGRKREEKKGRKRKEKKIWKIFQT
jgi:hypothetical protein